MKENINCKEQNENPLRRRSTIFTQKGGGTVNRGFYRILMEFAV
jgi:hypothetical protein